MPQLTREEQISIGITPPPVGVKEVEPNTRVTQPKKQKRLFRNRLTLSEEKTDYVKKILKAAWDEWETNTSTLRSKLQRVNDIMEGMKEPKDFPWLNCSNLHIPVIESHVTILHSVVSNTMLEQDRIWYVKTLLNGVGESVDTDVENFLDWSCRINTSIDVVLSDIYWLTYKDGSGIGDLDWMEDIGRRYDVHEFNSAAEFEKEFPTPDSAGMSVKAYTSTLQDFLQYDSIQLRIEEDVVKYRGPKLRSVELKDFVVVPTTSPDLEYAMVVGDLFVQRGDYFRKKVKAGWFSEDEVDTMLKTPGLTKAPDSIAASQDQIEGIARARTLNPDEYLCLQGILNINLTDDETEPERKYLFVYHRESNALLRIEEYPYLHDRCKYIIWRFKKRPNRLPGQSVYDQLIDINDEVDTQHNQRIDTRTITTVPSFVKLETSDFDPSRKDQRFYPGVVFKTSNFNQFKQLDIKQTDLGESLQEEQNLLALADIRTGATQGARSGYQKDPRAPAKKMMAQIQQSNQRLDDHMRELKISTRELGFQILELWYQFAPDMIPFASRDPLTGIFIQQQVKRQKLRSSATYLEVAHSSVTDNPAFLVQKYLTEYEILSKNPIIAQNIYRLRELTYRLVKSLREPNIDKLVPSVEDMQKELAQQEQMLNSPGQPGTTRALGETLKNSGPKRNKPEPGQTREHNGAAPVRALDTSGNGMVSNP